jgi:hypothetical protein
MNMKKPSSIRALFALLGLAMALPVPSAQAQDIGVSIGINQPGFYGRVDIGNSQPVLLYPQPVIIAPPAYGVRPRPIYMRVPPGHAKDWKRYCARYNACHQPVYFVRDDDRGHYQPYGQPERHEHHGDPDRDDRHDHGKGRGHGHGKGHGRGHD